MVKKSKNPPVKSHLSRPIGRPRTRHEPLITIPTRCPEALHRYLKTIFPLEFSSLTASYEHILSRFIADRPWDHGLHWRKPRVRVVVTTAGGVGSTGWVQVNVQVPADMADQIERIAATAGISKAAFLYTSFFWWAMYIKPPRKYLPSTQAVLPEKPSI